MAINPGLWALIFIWGMVLGLFYFGGLYMTLKHITRTARPKLLLGISFGIRLFWVLAGFWAVISRHGPWFLLTFAAFLLTRTLLTRTLGKENPHASQS